MTKLRLLNNSPTTSQIIRLTYLIPHTIDASASTFNQSDFYAICLLAASFCCRVLANKAVQFQDTTISADSVDYANKSTQYTSRADDLEKQYKEAIGKQEAEAASIDQDLDFTNSFNEEYLTHDKSYR
jgi:hypothetical protein